MSPDLITAVVLLVLFLATFVRSALGFGEALIAVPLLALVMPVQVAAPLAVLVSISVAAVVLLQDSRHVHVGSARRRGLSTLVGTPLGLWALVYLPERIVQACLGVVILAFSLHALLGRRERNAPLIDERLAWVFGFGAGVLGGAYGMNGPPLVIYGTLRGWSPKDFRATLQGYFLPASLMAMGGYWLAGLWRPAVTHYYVIGLPVMALAIALGRAVNGRLSEATFLRFVHGGLVVVAGLLLFQSLT
jgi:uncharacterized membrane protein YfcA